MRDAAAENKTTDWLFQPSMDITTDQYRLVTPRDASAASEGDYAYPQVPLTFDQRKSASDASTTTAPPPPRPPPPPRGGGLQTAVKSFDQITILQRLFSSQLSLST